ncbi:MAG TPA: DUF2382 domain-containing protein [Mycobacteriales bacterium]|jgi:uncharacterized protein (TIGR02271 family)|nr:DUF2382 domain-containing protein [Mycobacteriales bacterium]
MTASRGADTRDDLEVIRSEEELAVATEVHEVGRVRAHKEVDIDQHREVVPRGVEHADVERSTEIADGDSGQVETLPDGSISVPVFEERIFVEKRLVVRERVIIRKQTTTEEHVVEADLRRERVEIETEGDVGGVDH